MSIISDIAGWDRKFAWSFFGFLLAVFFGGLTLYNEFIKDPNPELSILVVGDTDVLDVREEVPELKIVYGDVDIKSVGQTLSVVVFKIQNTGGVSILNGFYDDKAIPKIQLDAAKFIKVEQVSATSNYLSEFAKPTLADQHTIDLPKVILEPDEAYTIKTLILRGPRTLMPFKVTGKVAGVKELKITPLQNETQQQSFWAITFSGTVQTQLVRAVSYFFGFIALIGVVVISVTLVLGRVQRLYRSRIVKRFRDHYRNDIDEPGERLLDLYRAEGLAPLLNLQNLLGNDEKLKKRLALMSKHEKSLRFRGQHETDQEPMSESDISKLDRFFAHHTVPFQIFRELKVAGLHEDGTLERNVEFEAFLGKFIDFVKPGRREGTSDN